MITRNSILPHLVRLIPNLKVRALGLEQFALHLLDRAPFEASTLDEGLTRTRRASQCSIVVISPLLPTITQLLYHK
jgi:hypothetical protein